MSNLQSDKDHIEKTGARSRLHAAAYATWLNAGLATFLKKRRVRIIESCLGFSFDEIRRDGERLKICEVGCGSGKDFVRHLFESPNEIWGIDPIDCNIKQSNFKYVQADAAHIPVTDKYFDAVVSIGVLEHVEPIEHLCAVISEISRVSKSYAVVVPCIDTFLEPHTQQIRWQLKPIRKLDRLNYFSDTAWLKFNGFEGAKIKRFYYLPGLIKNIVIYRNES